MDNHNEKKTKQIKRILAIITIVFVILIGYFIGRPLVHFVSDPKKFRAEKDVVFHLKEIWFYLTKSFPDREKYLKRIRKCQSLPEYKLIVQQIFS